MSTIDFNLPLDFGKLANARTLIACVIAVNDDNTVNLTLFNQTIANVPTNYHCRHQHINHARRIFLNGDSVICLYTGEGAVPAANNLRVLGFPGGYLRDCILAGIILHPRSGPIVPLSYAEYISIDYGYTTSIKTTPGVPGGWRDGQIPLTTGFIYPLVDNDNASFVLAKRTAVLSGEFAGSDGNYGNLYWLNDAVPFRCLSWKGTPTRHARLPSNINLHGMSIVERVVSGAFGDKLDFTTFGVNLYQGGAIVAQAPRYSWPPGGSLDRCLILGAMMNSHGITFIVTQNDHYGKPDAAGGFFLGVWSNVASGSTSNIRVDGWELLLEVEHTRVGLPWFGNSTGSEFVCGNGDSVSIAYTASTPPAIATSYTAYTQPAGTFSETLGGDIRYNVAYSAAAAGLTFFHEYQGAAKVNAIVNISFSTESIVGTGHWSDPVVSKGSPKITGGNVTAYTDTSLDTYPTSQYCYVTEVLPSNYDKYYRCNAYDVVQQYEVPGPTMACVAVHPIIGDPKHPYNKGITKYSRGRGRLVTWVGDLPGTSHNIATDFSINVCGVNIPIIKTDRTWKNERTPHASIGAETAGVIKGWIEEDCSVTRSVIYYLDERYGVCLYKSTKDIIIVPRIQSSDVSHFIAYGALQRSATVVLTRDDYTATSTETWHLVVNGVDSVVAESMLELFPFGEPMNSVEYGYEDVVEVFALPKIAASSAALEGEAAQIFGSYEDGYDDPFGAQAQADGGLDYFYPAWCRSLGEDPVWKMVAAARYGFTYPGSIAEASGTVSWTPPDILVEPIPCGSFVRHPIVGDLYQFLISQHTGSNMVITSKDINNKIDVELAKNSLATHGTTLYFPIALI